MLSEDLAAFRQVLLKYADTGMEIAPQGVREIANWLLDMVLDAAALEQSRISPVATAPEDSLDNVVSIRADALGGVA